MKKIVVTGLLALALGAAMLPETEASADGRVPIILGQAVPVGCTNPGSPQDVGKTPILKNTTNTTLGKNFLVTWSASDGDHNSIRLDADLPPGGTVKALGTAGGVYTCSAQFFSEPDLTVKSAVWENAGSLKVEVQNLDPWVGSAPSTVRVEVVSCAGPVLHAYDSAPISFAKSETKTITFAAQYQGTRTYLRVTADAKSNVIERNEHNNVLDAINSCVQ
jgi:hypothetical protein